MNSSQNASNKHTFQCSENGKHLEPFRTVVRISSGPAVFIQGVAFPDGLGLEFDAQTKEVYGIPLLAGEHSLKIDYSYSEVPDGARPLMQGVCTLVVNPDPRLLWKDLPSDTQDEYWKPDEAELHSSSDGAASRFTAASKRGRSHAHTGSFRDDHFIHRASGDWNILAMGDGAGSASRSRWGSKLATEKAVEVMERELLGPQGAELLSILETWEAGSSAPRPALDAGYRVIGTAVLEALKAIQAEAAIKGFSVKDYSTTLMLVACCKTIGGYLILSYLVGDGVIAVYRKNEDVEILGKGDSGEFAGQTRFLDAGLITSEDLMSRMRVKFLPAFTGVVVMTDGVADPKFESDSKLSSLEAWQPLWSEIELLLEKREPGKELLQWLDFWSPGNHDDRTIAVLG